MPLRGGSQLLLGFKVILGYQPGLKTLLKIKNDDRKKNASYNRVLKFWSF